jgi:hypothetical protein
MPSLAQLGVHTTGTVPKQFYGSHSKAGQFDQIFLCFPMVITLVSCMPGWMPVLCRKLCYLLSSLSIQSLRRTMREQRPEVLGFSSVIVAVLVGLLVAPGGHLSSADAFRGPVDEQSQRMRKLWPWMLHSDSLLIAQQLLRGLSAWLLVCRGGAASSGGAFAPALLQLAAASGLRLFLWSTSNEYKPEGPLGGKFAICFVAVTFLAQIVAACKALRAAQLTPWHSRRILGLEYVVQVVLVLWSARTNHFTLGSNIASDIVFSAIEAADMCAAPIFGIAAYVAASENASSVTSGLHAMMIAQMLGFQWYLAFSSASEMHKSVFGDPGTLLTASHLVQLFAMVVPFRLGLFLSEGVKAAPKHVIDALEMVQYTNEMFSDDPNACCAICLEDFEEGDQLRRLPCQHHQFHAACLEHWLAKAGRCPLCVADITKST